MAIKSKLAERITEALIEDERTKESAIEVLDENGVITLTGTAASNEARQAAGAIAKDFDDVVSVTNDLEVDPHAIAEDVPPLAPALTYPSNPR